MRQGRQKREKSSPMPHVSIAHSLLPIAYRLLPIAYLLIAYLLID